MLTDDMNASIVARRKALQVDRAASRIKAGEGILGHHDRIGAHAADGFREIVGPSRTKARSTSGSLLVTLSGTRSPRSRSSASCIGLELLCAPADGRLTTQPGTAFSQARS